jgi:hypothetical protein
MNVVRLATLLYPAQSWRTHQDKRMALQVPLAWFHHPKITFLFLTKWHFIFVHKHQYAESCER